MMMFRKKSFRKYVIIGLSVMVTTTTLSTLSLYVGREMMGISVLILNPVVSLSMFTFGFLMKYYLYDRWDMLKDG